MQTTLTGKTVSITGTLSKGRKQYVAMIERLGGTFKTHVSNAVNYLIVGPDAYVRDTEKLERAEQLNLLMLTEQEFLAMVSENN